MHPIPKNTHSVKTQNNIPDLSPQKPIEEIIYTKSVVCIPLYLALTNHEGPTFYLHHGRHKITPFFTWVHYTESNAACPNEIEEIIRVPFKQLLYTN